jgi:hypothetical protein
MKSTTDNKKKERVFFTLGYKNGHVLYLQIGSFRAIIRKRNKYFTFSVLDNMILWTTGKEKNSYLFH